MTLVQCIQLELLKRRARRIIHRLDAIFDSYSCDRSLTLHIARGRVEPLLDELDEVFDKIRAIDPSAPGRDAA